MTEPPNKPNYTLAWFRVILWILPTGIAWTSGMAIGWWSGLATTGNSIALFVAWVIFNLLFTLAVGYYWKMLSTSRPTKPYRAILFLISQIFVVPLLSSVVLLAVFAWHPMMQ